jgi:hypothetical protein
MWIGPEVKSVKWRNLRLEVRFERIFGDFRVV